MDTTRMDAPPLDAAAARPAADERSLLHLCSQLWRETTTLVHKEAELARAEIYEKGSQLGKAVAAIGTGGAVLFGGFLVLLFAAVAGLWVLFETEHEIWLAPLIVGLAVMAIGYVMLAGGRRKLQAAELTPERTVRSLRRDAQLAKEHMK